MPGRADAPVVAHVLDRIGFGARPGDVARVQRLGLAAYIEQQLHPERIADDAMTARLSEFTTLSMTSSETGGGDSSGRFARRSAQRRVNCGNWQATVRRPTRHRRSRRRNNGSCSSARSR